MGDGSGSLVLRFMRQVDAKLDRVIEDLANLKVRVTNVEENLVAASRRMDRLDLRIERRLNLTETAAWGAPLVSIRRFPF